MLGALFKAIPLPWKIVAALALAGAVSGFLWWWRAEGYAEGKAVAEAACLAEKLAQREANTAAAYRAYGALRTAAEQIRELQQEIDNAKAEADAAATAELGDRPSCLTPDSMRRINAVR